MQSNKESTNCTNGVISSDKKWFSTLKPLWNSAMELELGSNHDINIYRIVLIF